MSMSQKGCGYEQESQKFGKGMYGNTAGVLLYDRLQPGEFRGRRKRHGRCRERKKADYDLAAESWAEEGEIEDSAEVWTLIEYREDFGQPASDQGMTLIKSRGVSDGTDYYILEDYLLREQTAGAARKYYLTHVDMRTMECRRAELILSGEGQEERLGLAEDMRAGQACITGMDVRDGNVCLLVAQLDGESDAPAYCYAIRLDEQWNVEGAVDLLPGLEMAGMCSDGIPPEGFFCDGEGRFYVGTERYGIFDSTGEFLKMLEASGGKESFLHQTCRLPDGRPVFEALDAESRQTTLFCLDGLEKRVLYQGACSYTETRYINEKGEIFFAAGAGCYAGMPPQESVNAFIGIPL